MLDEIALESFTTTCRQEDPPAKVDEFVLGLDTAFDVLLAARNVCGIAPSSTILTELQDHPEMLVWVMQGHEYHAAHSLKE